MILLSICIPTYNREKYLKATLSNVTAQIAGLDDPASVEVVVSDNASSDETPEVIDSFRSFGLAANRNAENLGPSRNLNTVICMAKGRYCWLMGDDDLVQPGALKKIVKIVSDNIGTGLFFINYRNKDNPVAIIRLPGDLLFKTAQSYIDYGLSHFNVNEWDPAKFTFYTSLIVDREKWISAPVNSHPVISHAYTIHSFLPGSPVYFIAEPLVVMNDAPLVVGSGPSRFLYYWLEMYWFMGRQYGRRLGFLRIMLWACIANLKYRLLLVFHRAGNNQGAK